MARVHFTPFLNSKQGSDHVKIISGAVKMNRLVKHDATYIVESVNRILKLIHVYLPGYIWHCSKQPYEMALNHLKCITKILR
mmetsp:Transcript_3569/g.6716  ORF Transcript_3569/g.6716 Transcript_3569/m.6716 type:complete len:82 (+) Transcript_3569:445-690(+)